MYKVKYYINADLTEINSIVDIKNWKKGLKIFVDNAVTRNRCLKSSKSGFVREHRLFTSNKKNLYRHSNSYCF